MLFLFVLILTFFIAFGSYPNAIWMIGIRLRFLIPKFETIISQDDWKSEKDADKQQKFDKLIIN